MDLDDIDQWSRELLQREARKRGYVNAGMYSRPELIKLILRHDYGSAGSVKKTARTLLGSARTMLMRGIEAAAHARLGRGAKRAAELSRPPSRATGEDAWRAQRAAAEQARGRAGADGERFGSASAQADVAGDARAAREARDAREARAASEARAAEAEEPSRGQASAVASGAASLAQGDKPSSAVSPFTPAASSPVEQTPELRPPDVGRAPLELQEALNEAQRTAAAAPLESQPASARVDPSPELRPPAVQGVAQLRPPNAGVAPLELDDALNQAQRTAATAPMQPAASSVRVDPSPELRPPVAAGFPPAGVELRAQPETFELAMPREEPMSPWSASLPPPPAPKPVVVPQPAAAPEPAFPSGVEQLSYGAHSEYGLSLRWQVTSSGVERARLVLGGPGELAVRIVAVRVDAHAEVQTEIVDHGPVEHIGVWIAPLPAKGARYVSSIGLRTAERFVSIAHAAS